MSMFLNLKSKFTRWKMKREKTIETLMKLAEESDKVQIRISRWKFGGSLTSLAVSTAAITIGTGGLSIPWILLGTGLSLIGTLASTKADMDISSFSDNQKKEVENVINNELNTYESLRKSMQKLEEHLQNVCELNGWPSASEAFPITTSFTLYGGVSLPIKQGQNFIAPIMALGLTHDHNNVMKAVEEVRKGATTTINGAKQLLKLAAENSTTAVDKLQIAIKAAEKEAEISSKTFETSKSALQAIKKTASVIHDLSDVSRTTSTAIQFGQESTKLVAASADDAMSIIAKGTSLADEASNIVTTFNNVVSPGLCLLGLAMDCWGMYTSYGTALGGQKSDIGKFIREKAEAMKRELQDVESFVNLQQSSETNSSSTSD